MRKRSLLFTLLVLASLAALTGCGVSFANAPQTSSTTPVTPAADFSLTATPAGISLTGGGAGLTISVTATALNGFSAPVAVSFGGLPAGVTASPATLTLAAGAPQTVTLTANATVAAGSANLTFTGVSGSLTHTANVSLTIAAAAAAPAGDFSLGVTPAMQTIVQGAAGTPLSVLATGTNGFASPVAVAITGLPAGVSASPAMLTLTPGTPQTVTLSAGASAAVGAATVNFAGTSGALAHSAALALTVQAAVVAPPPPAADFSLSVTPGTQTIVQGAAGTALSVLATAVNSFNATVAVTITGLPANVTASPATLALTPGTAQSVTLTAGASAAAGGSTITFTGTAGTLSRTVSLGLTIQSAPPPAAASPDVTTYHYDNTRQGLNAQETILTPTNVASATFGKLRSFAADGKVDAQPLYLYGLTVNGVATNVLYMASEHGTVYAMNADTGAQIWQVSLLGTGETTSDDHNCSQITPEIGITATPVIDRAKGVIYVVAMSKNGSAYHQRLHALSLTTGAEQSGSPSEIAGSYPGTGDNSTNGNVIFDPGQYAERVGLLLLNGQIYLAWTSHCDYRPYTGWVMAYDESTLKQTAILNLTPNGSDGSIWMSGYGMAADASGNIYFLDANGTLDTGFDSNGFPAQHDYGNAIVKLSTAGGTLAVADYFEPYNTTAESNADVDLGSGGAMLLPDVTDASGKTRHLLVGAGKDGHIYVGDRDNLGKFNATNNSNVYQDLVGVLPNGAWSGPAYFNGTVYYAGQADTLKAFPIASARLAATPSSQSAQAFAYPGSTPTVSANGAQNGIVWALEDGIGALAVLHAYDPADLSKEFYNSNQGTGGRDNFGLGNKFLTPVVVNGQVFIGTPTGVVEFGLLP